MKDPYALLGVDREASAEDIKRAYRALARTLHPDVNTKDPRAEDRFKEVNAAYDLLSDATKRARFDRGEIDANGQERGFGFGRGAGARRGGATGQGAGSGFGGGFGGGWGGGGDGGAHFRFDDLFKGAETFEDIFARAQAAKRGSGGRAGGGAGREPAARGGDAQYRLRISFEEAIRGATRRISLTNGRTLNVRIPPGTESGSTLRLRGQGKAGSHGGDAGDALVEILVRDHPVFRRQGDDVIAEVPVLLSEAVLGARITVPTVDGRVAVTVPEGSNAGAVLRLKGKGAPRKDGPAGARGDQLVRLRVVIDDPADERLRQFLRGWRPANARDARADLEDPAAPGS
ncbi:DnaJ C-terminal domain-containing protein [Roseospira visakhapatnamensis]|uniref:DnaJ-class molecular chaperone n=1 Tax=Roseospira visakhapatnamensis TaxID=390880 RepID=A0A7W6W897_9PROT|nr:J domain-containing protein [Roseospira visakhapatnamensis]MBB4264619.1 DnaJ-class molecular chaperone [Roseospira visakhapatnamensis]